MTLPNDYEKSNFPVLIYSSEKFDEADASSHTNIILYPENQIFYLLDFKEMNQFYIDLDGILE